MTESTAQTKARLQSHGSPKKFRGENRLVAMYSHDTYGLGHLRRSLKIARALRAAYPELSLLIMTGSSELNSQAIPPGVDIVKLPSVIKTADERYQSRSLHVSFERTLRARSEIILACMQAYEPDLLLVDHSPVGMKGELRQALTGLARSDAKTIVALGLRDIVDSPDRVIKRWRSEGVYDVLEEAYHHILIYGQPEIFDPLSKYEFSPKLRHKTEFCGYIAGAFPSGAKAEAPLSDRRPLVLVTIGGGDYYGQEIIGTYLEMVREHLNRITFDTRIICGPLIDRELYERLSAAAAGLPVGLAKITTDMERCMAEADFVIATGGYNTTVETLTHARRAMIIPRVTMRDEQLIRTTRLAELGALTMMHPDDITPKKLFFEVTRGLYESDDSVRNFREENKVNLGGVERVTTLCGELLAAAQDNGADQ
ncbi:MAG TPA: glycosyltransferase [candidate division Zixibacteria bacterium]|nr:glycosyltransferase [candidate division Zixibacteria bacterium]